MAHVELTSHLHLFFPSLHGEEIVVKGGTVREVVDAVETLVPGFAFYICDERGRLRQHVNIFIENERIKDRGTLTDAVQPDSRVFILQALSGG